MHRVVHVVCRWATTTGFELVAIAGVKFGGSLISSATDAVAVTPSTARTKHSFCISRLLKRAPLPRLPPARGVLRPRHRGRRRNGAPKKLRQESIGLGGA